MKRQFSKTSTRSDQYGFSPAEKRRNGAKNKDTCFCEHCTHLQEKYNTADPCSSFKAPKAKSLRNATTKKKMPKKMVTSRWMVPPPDITDSGRILQVPFRSCRCLPLSEEPEDVIEEPSMRQGAHSPLANSTVQSPFAAVKDCKDEIRLRESFNVAMKEQQENQQVEHSGYDQSHPQGTPSPPEFIGVECKDFLSQERLASDTRTLRHGDSSFKMKNSGISPPSHPEDSCSHSSNIADSKANESIKEIREALKSDDAFDLSQLNKSSSSISCETFKSGKGVLKPPMTSEIRKRSAKLFEEKCSPSGTKLNPREPSDDFKYKFSTIDNCGTKSSAESIKERINRHLMNEKARESAQMRLITKSQGNDVHVDVVSSLDEARIAVLEKTVDGCTWGVKVYRM